MASSAEEVTVERGAAGSRSELDEAKSERDEACFSDDRLLAAAEWSRGVPDDVWGVIVSFAGTVGSMRLSRTCCELRGSVLRSIRVARIEQWADSFPAARLTALVDVMLDMRVEHAPALSALQLCPSLQSLSLDCRLQPPSSCLLAALPLFPALRAVTLRWVLVNGQLGSTLAQCEALKAVQLLAPGGSSRSEQRRENVSAFLRELSGCHQLRQLRGLRLRDDGDRAELCAALCAWEQLEELQIRACPDNGDRGRPMAVTLDDVASVAADSCPLLHSLQFDSKRQQTLSERDADAIGRMASLRQLHLFKLQLPSTFFSGLHRLKAVQSLQLDLRRLEDGSWEELAAFVRSQPVRVLHVFLFDLPFPAAIALLAAVAAHGSLTEVEIRTRTRTFERDEMEAAGAAVAEALCQSTAHTWRLRLPFRLLSLLRTWHGRQPTAALRSVRFLHNSVGELVEDDGFPPLLLSCLRSSPSLREVYFELRSVRDEVITELVDAVEAEPLACKLVVSYFPKDALSMYTGEEEELHKLGLFLYQ
eukprot:PLAT4624.2.p1 GENE.PLAT4624.2~~PLAT4624.2.p1  ORF type:complete len:534 (+),score=106.68 PLAT4624.2:366-1967(+)